jgi:hypothetical protein
MAVSLNVAEENVVMVAHDGTHAEDVQSSII